MGVKLGRREGQIEGVSEEDAEENI